MMTKKSFRNMRKRERERGIIFQYLLCTFDYFFNPRKRTTLVVGERGRDVLGRIFPDL